MKTMEELKRASEAPSTFKLSDVDKEAPHRKGCYLLLLNGNVMYVGKAESGLKNRLSQHYNNKNPLCNSEQQISKFRDRLSVICKICNTKKECAQVEKDWIIKYDPPWNERIG